ncbi:MAG: hypothetical protein ABEH77_10120 [Halobacteriaceae archaeon]
MVRAREPWVLGAAVGGLAFLAGYLAVAAVVVPAVDHEQLSTAVAAFHATAARERLLVEAALGDPWRVAGWAFYQAHFVPTASTLPTDVDPPVTVDLLWVGLTPWVRLVPPLALAATGGLAVGLGRVTGRADAAVHGAATAVGYLPPAALGPLLFRLEAGGDAVYVAGWRALVFAGLAYPLAFGTAGALVAWRFLPR